MTVDTQSVLVAVVSSRISVPLILALRELDCASRLIGSGRDAIAKLSTHPADLVLVEDDGATVDGLALTASLRGLDAYADVPIVLIGTGESIRLHRAALDAGATDIVAKPLDTLELTVRLRVLLELAALRRDSDRRVRDATRQVDHAVGEIAAREREVIRRLMLAAELHDDQASGHLARVAGCVIAIAEGLGQTEDEANDLGLASTMHDIGKIAISDGILRKAGPLTPPEREAMEQHTLHGHRILAGSRAPLLQHAAEIALSHHERWDGTGYPRRLAGEAIPLPGRIVAVADVFDALVSARRYKPAWPLDRARAEIVTQSGRHFDPDCVTAFLSRWWDIAALIEDHHAAA